MKTFRFAVAPIVLSLVIVPLIAGAVYFSDAFQETGEAADAKFGQLDVQEISAKHQATLRLFAKRRMVDFQKFTTVECMKDLSRTLGIEIQFDPSMKRQINQKGWIKLSPKHSISHYTAIRLVMQHFSFYGYGIAFGDDGLSIVAIETYKGKSLRTYDLTSHSDFSIAKRQRVIDSIVKLDPKSWGVAQGTWIKPGESIFEIDVYQSSEMHHKVSKLVNLPHPVITLDQDVQSLSFISEINRKKEGKELDKEAVVKRLRKKYPLESIGDRLKYESGKGNEVPKLSPEMSKQMQKLEQSFEANQKSQFSFTAIRGQSLKLLHEAEVEDFVGRPGAGFFRMPPPGPSYLRETPTRQLPLASNEMIRSSDDTPVDLPETKSIAATAKRVFLPSRESLQQFHQNGQYLFTPRPSYGYVKNRNAVAGFQSHGFTSSPRLLSHITRSWYRKEKEMWAIHRLELVSLLKHETPAVYVSRNLPNMEELKNVKTRKLGDFEQSALKRLRNGEDVVTKATLNRIEMVGSLRASKECMQCHEVKRGALLGAFSYELLRDPQLDPRIQPETTTKRIF